jgi:predicted kinase
MKQLIVLIGLPAAGKSTYSANLNIDCLNTDSIRKEIYGDSSVQGGKEWVIFYERLEEFLAAGEDLIIDNTNLKHRNKLLDTAAKYGYTVHYKVFLTDLWKCIERNNKRERQVPESVILNMYRILNQNMHLFYSEPTSVEFINGN